MSADGATAKETFESEWLGHLTELRRRLIYVSAWFVASLCAGLYLSPRMLEIARGSAGAIEVRWSVFALTDGIVVYMKCALLVAVLLTLPLLLYHFWAFARPGLTDAEAKTALLYVPASFALFAAGIGFGYSVAVPMMIRFMVRLNQGIGAAEVYGIHQYVGFLVGFLLPMGVAFEMPLVMMFLTRIGLLTPDKIRPVRKYAYVGLAIAGTLISPPDFASHLSVTIPLLVLFEIGAFVSARFHKRRNLAPLGQA